MSDPGAGTGADLGKKGIRFVVSIVGLLLLKAVVGALPMLKNASTIGGSLLTPTVLVNAIADTLIIVAVVGFGLTLSRALRRLYWRVPDLSEGVLLVAALLVLVLAYNLYQVPIACVLISPQDLFNVQGAVVPAQLGAQFGELVRQLTNGTSGQLPDILRNSVGSVMEGYQKLAVLKLRQPPDVYGWTFLVLAAIPVVRIGVLGSRNLDTISDLIFHKAKTVARGEHEGSSRDQEWSSQNIDKLSHLKSLVDAGVITQADFDAQKQMLLYGSRPPVSYYILRAGQQYGPYTTDDLQTHLQQGAVLYADLARTAATQEWVPLSQLLQTSRPPAPPPPSQPQTPAPELQRLKQLLDAGALTQEEYETQKQRLLARL